MINFLKMGVAIGLLSYAHTLTADIDQYKKPDDGWHFYNEEYPAPINEPVPSPPQPTEKAESEEPPEKLTKVTPPAPPAGPKPLSSEWFRENLTKYRDLAVDEPTEENVQRYAYLERVAKDKASKFAQVMQRVVLADEHLDENTRRPISTLGGRALDRQSINNKDKLIKRLAKEVGIWYFYSSTCSYCVKQTPIVEMLQRVHGFTVLPIAMDGQPDPAGHFKETFVKDTGQSQALQVDVTPTIFLVRPPNDYIKISNGILAESQITTRIINAALKQGWITEEDVDDTRPIHNQLFTAEIEKELDETAIQDTQTLVDYVRERIRAQ